MKRFLLAVAVALAVAPLSPQAQVARSSKWTLPRTPDGHPDLQGLWTTQTYTPLQRPDRYAGKEFLTEAEAAEFTRIVTQAGVDPLAGGVFAARDE